MGEEDEGCAESPDQPSTIRQGNECYGKCDVKDRQEVEAEVAG